MMKKAIAILIILSGMCAYAKAQQQTDRLNEKDKGVQFSSGDKVTIEDDGNLITYFGNASVTTGIISVKNAEKVEYNVKAKKIIVYNFEGFTTKGSVNIRDTNLKPAKLEFTIGETVAYIN